MQKHILVVDDDVRSLHLIKSYLSDIYKVTCFPSGDKALLFLAATKVDAILLDYMMPDTDGTKVLADIRSRDRLKDIPVIFLTAVKDKKKVVECLSLMPQGYLIKPVERAVLLKKLASVLEGRS